MYSAVIVKVSYCTKHCLNYTSYSNNKFLYIVEVALPFQQRYTYSQPGSSVIVNCTAESSNIIDAALAWFIRLPGRENFNAFPLSRKTLNDQGFYEFETEAGIQLLINSTLGKNGTVIRCIDTSSSKTIAETVLIVDGKIHMILTLCSFIII